MERANGSRRNFYIKLERKLVIRVIESNRGISKFSYIEIIFIQNLVTSAINSIGITELLSLLIFFSLFAPF